MALNFPDSPSNGDIAHGFTYNSTKGVWEANNDAVVSDTAPSNPNNGDFWFDSTTAKLYVRYEDGSSNQWVTVNGADGASASATVYANTSALPSSGNSVGDLAFATATKSLHVWDGSEWDRISSGGDETPTLTTTPATTHSLNNDGSTSTITIAASDPDGFPITYSHDTNPSNPNQVTNITNSGGTFTLTPSTNTAHAGNFTLRLKASDGVSTISHSINTSLVFYTTFTFDTSESVINTNYTADNKVEAYVRHNTNSATAEQIGKLGKGYYEMKLISYTGSGHAMLGLQVGTNKGSYVQNTGAFAFQQNGQLFNNDAGSTTYGIGASSYTTNDIIMIAYDTAASPYGQVWLGKNGSWGRNPATQGGFEFLVDASSAGVRPAVSQGGTSLQTFQVEIISHTQGAQYTIPSGWELA